MKGRRVVILKDDPGGWFWWMFVFPGLAIFLTVLCVNMLGDGLREALDPRMR
jgi:ABC-type dipeptide/oligopeptide/nickel transport system permease subunit